MKYLFALLVVLADPGRTYGHKRLHGRFGLGLGINAGINIGIGKGCHGYFCRQPPPAPPQIIVIPGRPSPPIYIPGPPIYVPVPVPVSAERPLATPPPGYGRSIWFRYVPHGHPHHEEVPVPVAPVPIPPIPIPIVPVPIPPAPVVPVPIPPIIVPTTKKPKKRRPTQRIKKPKAV